MKKSCHLSFKLMAFDPVLHSLLTSIFATVGNLFIAIRQSLERIMREFILHVCQTIDIPNGEEVVIRTEGRHYK